MQRIRKSIAFGYLITHMDVLLNRSFWDEDRLRRLLEDHTLAEESRVFPRAVSTYKERSVAES